MNAEKPRLNYENVVVTRRVGEGSRPLFDRHDLRYALESSSSAPWISKRPTISADNPHANPERAADWFESRATPGPSLNIPIEEFRTTSLNTESPPRRSDREPSRHEVSPSRRRNRHRRARVRARVRERVASGAEVEAEAETIADAHIVARTGRAPDSGDASEKTTTTRN